MANPDYVYGAFAKDKMIPVKVQRDLNRRDKNAKLDAAYDVVNTREQNICQVSGVRLLPESPDAKTRRQHHHIKGRRVRPEWVTDPDRIVLCSDFCHDLITKGWIVVEGELAPKAKFHWADHVKAEHKTFRLKSKRRSQNRAESDQ
jgi:hypothetical protein